MEKNVSNVNQWSEARLVQLEAAKSMDVDVDDGWCKRTVSV